MSKASSTVKMRVQKIEYRYDKKKNADQLNDTVKIQTKDKPRKHDNKTAKFRFKERSAMIYKGVNGMSDLNLSSPKMIPNVQSLSLEGKILTFCTFCFKRIHYLFYSVKKKKSKSTGFKSLRL